MKIRTKLNEFLNSWAGIVSFILIAILILYFLIKTRSVALYSIVVISIPIFYYFKKQDVLPYIYGGIFLAFLVHLFLGIIFSTSSPVVAVVSSSMEHDQAEITHYSWLEKNFGYNRTYIDSWPFSDGFSMGDIPIVRNSNDYKMGDIIVYDAGQTAPIIHRIIKINPDGTYQTKGDNNLNQNSYEFSVKGGQIRGKVIFIIPKLGYFKIMATKIFGVF